MSPDRPGATPELGEAETTQLDWTSWWGIPTFFRCAIETDPEAADIAIVGVPHSSGNGTTERDQHLGPRAVRNVSPEYRRYHREFGFAPWERCRIVDFSATCRCPAPWTTTTPCRTSRPGIGAWMRRAPAPSPSAETTRSPCPSCGRSQGPSRRSRASPSRSSTSTRTTTPTASTSWARTTTWETTNGPARGAGSWPKRASWIRRGSPRSACGATRAARTRGSRAAGSATA